MKRSHLQFWIGCLGSLWLAALVHSESVLKPLPIAKIKHTGAVDFEKEILPILKQNCLACHNQTKAKGALILETPQAILKGGDTGPALIPKKPKESLLLRAASHQEADLEMPPPDNKVAAHSLNPDELGLIQLWIEQGANGEVRGMGPISWQPLPSQLKTIYAVALSGDGHLAACGRGNRVFVYDLPRGSFAEELIDETLRSSTHQTVAHRDTVNSLAFSPDGELLASGGYREIKLWRRSRSLPAFSVQKDVELSAHGRNADAGASVKTGAALLEVQTNGVIKLSEPNTFKVKFEINLGTAPDTMAVRPDGKFVAAGIGNTVKLWRVSDAKQVAEIKGDGRLAEVLATGQRELAFAQSEVEYHKAALKTFETNHSEFLARQKRAAEADVANAKVLIEKETALTNAISLQQNALNALDEIGVGVGKLVERFLEAEQGVKIADKNAMQGATNLLAEATAALETLPTETKEKRKSATEKLISAKKAVTEAEDALKPARITKSAGDHELQLALAALQKSADSELGLKRDIEAAVAELAQAEKLISATIMTETESEKPVIAIAFSPDNHLLISGASDGVVRVWSAETGAYCSTVGTVKGLESLSFDHAGKLAVQTSYGITSWDFRSKWVLERTIGTGGDNSPLADRVNALRFTKDGKLLISGGGEPSREGEIKIWDMRDGHLARELKNVHSDSVFALDLSPDGRYLASASADRFARVTDFETGKVLKNLEGHTHHVLGVAWKHNARSLLTAGADNVGKSWDFATAERKKNIEGFTKEVTSVSFIGLGDQALVTAGDGQILIVNEEGAKVRGMEGSADYIYSGAATADGRTIVAGGSDGVLRIWNGLDGKPVRELKPPFDYTDLGEK